MEKILLDTDIGCDIDDAICLAYLLARPDCRLLGVTTVNGDTVARAKLASAIIEASGQSVPVYPGRHPDPGQDAQAGSAGRRAGSPHPPQRV